LCNAVALVFAFACLRVDAWRNQRKLLLGWLNFVHHGDRRSYSLSNVATAEDRASDQIKGSWKKHLD
jgi:hypothetical protein